MKLFPLLLALAPALPSPLSAEMTLQAVACTLPHAHFALIDSISGDRRWISMGDDFAGYTARSYDPVTETLVLGREGHLVRLSLSRSARTLDPASEPPASTDANDLERTYWLATVRDEQAGGFMRRLGGIIKTRAALARELAAAEVAFARDPSRANARYLSEAKRKSNPAIQPEIFLWTRAVEAPASR